MLHILFMFGRRRSVMRGILLLMTEEGKAGKKAGRARQECRVRHAGRQGKA
jgi:hypothetical protein